MEWKFLALSADVYYLVCAECICGSGNIVCFFFVGGYNLSHEHPPKWWRPLFLRNPGSVFQNLKT